MQMLSLLLQSVMVVGISSHFATISPSDSVESGGRGTVRQCSSKLAEDILKFSCVQCALSEDQCPEHCCRHLFVDSANTTSMVCGIDRCCLRILSDGNGKSMFVAEALSSRSRRENTTSCDRIEVDFQCPHCAFAVSENEILQCSLGVAVPGWEQPYEGSLCVDSNSNGSKPGANGFQSGEGKSTVEDVQNSDDPPKSMEQDPTTDGQDTEPEEVSGYTDPPTSEVSPRTLPSKPTKEPRESDVSKPSPEGSADDEEKTPEKDTMKDANPDEDIEPSIEGTTERLSTVVGIVVGTLSVLLLVCCGFLLICCRDGASCKKLVGNLPHIFPFASEEHITANRVKPPSRKNIKHSTNSDLTHDSSDGTRTPYDTERQGSEPDDDPLVFGHERRSRSAHSSIDGLRAQTMMDWNSNGETVSAAYAEDDEDERSRSSDYNRDIFVWSVDSRHGR